MYRNFLYYSKQTIISARSHFKILSNPLFFPYYVIHKSSLSFGKKKPLPSVKKSVSLRNSSDFLSITFLIEIFHSNCSTYFLSQFSELDLWNCIDFQRSLPTLQFLISNMSKLLTIFEDKEDLIRISKHSGSHLLLPLLIDDSVRIPILQRIGSLGLIRLCNHVCSHSIITYFSNSSNLDKLLLRFTIDDLVRIGSKSGALFIFESLNDKVVWSYLRSFFSKDQIVSIFSYVGSRNVLNYFLNPKVLPLLQERLGNDVLFQISCNDGAVRILKLVLNTSKWEQLQTIFSTESLLKICSNHGCNQVLEFFLDDANLSFLKSKMLDDEIVRIACNNGAKNVLYILVNPDNWALLLDRIGKESLIKVSFCKGARNVLDIFLDNNHWSVLKSRLSVDIIKNIARFPGARNVLNIILDNDSWFKLIDRIDKDTIGLISANNGAQNVLDIVLDDVSWPILLDRLSMQPFVKIAKHPGSRNVLKILLNDKKWCLLCERVGKEAVILLASHNGAQNVLDIILDNDKWPILVSRFGKSGITRICCHHGSRNLLNIIVDEKKWSFLKEHFSVENLFNIANSDGASNVFQFLLDKKKWTALTSLLDIETIVKACSKTCVTKSLNLILNSSKWTLLSDRIGLSNLKSILYQDTSFSILEIFLNDTKWKIINSVFTKEQIKDLIYRLDSALNLENLFIYYDLLSSYIDNKDLHLFPLMHFKDQQAVNDYSLSFLKTLGFSSLEILNLFRISGRHISYILSLIHDDLPFLDSLFDPSDGQSNFFLFHSVERLIKLFSTDHFYVSLTSKVISLTEFHRHCLHSPLSLDNLTCLKSIYSCLSLTPQRSMSHVKNMLFISGCFPVVDRHSVWESLTKKHYLTNKFWTHQLCELSIPLRKWFILKGIDSAFTLIKDMNSVSLNDSEMFFLMTCFQKFGIRKFFINRYHELILGSSILSKPFQISQTVEQFTTLSLPDAVHLNTRDWFLVTLLLYASIDREIYNYDFPTSMSSSSFFSDEEIKGFKHTFPTTQLKRGVFITTVKNNFMRHVLSPFYLRGFFQILLQPRSSVKRPNSLDLSNSSKRKIRSLPSILNELNNHKRSVSDGCWSSVEFYLSSSDSVAHQALHKSILSRSDKVPQSILCMFDLNTLNFRPSSSVDCLFNDDDFNHEDFDDEFNLEDSLYPLL